MEYFESKKVLRKALEERESQYQKLLIQFRQLLLDNHQLGKELDKCREINEEFIHRGIRKEVLDEV